MEDLVHGFIHSKLPCLNIFLNESFILNHFQNGIHSQEMLQEISISFMQFVIVVLFFLSCHNQGNHHDRTVNMNLIFPDDSCISVCLVIHNLTRWSQTTKYTAILLFPASLMLPFHNHSDFSPVPLFSPGRHQAVPTFSIFVFCCHLKNII